MALMRITRLENRSAHPVALHDVEAPTAAGHAVPVAPGAAIPVDMTVPWAGTAGEFPSHHLVVHVAGQPRFWLWQAAMVDGDHVRFARDGAWRQPGARVHGASVVDHGGERTLVVLDGCVMLSALPADLLSTVLATSPAPRFRLAASQPFDEQMAAVPSVPRRSAVAFSVAGPPSDAFDRGERDARLRYTDGGKRYTFAIDASGRVIATGPDGVGTPLTQAISYDRRRAGELFTAPPFDMVAANQGRVIAKAAGRGELYFTTMDHLFVHGDPSDGELTVPSMYFKNDPEFRQDGRRQADLLAHVDGCFADHPAMERLPVFREAFRLDLTDMMVVRVRRRVWHRLDVRPPLGAYNAMLPALALAEETLTRLEAETPDWPFLADLEAQVAALRVQVQDMRARLEAAEFDPYTLPPGLTGYPHVRYTDGASERVWHSIRYHRVLDVGAGHAHWHEVYDGTTGGEMQSMRARPADGSGGPAELYRALNGPLDDGDGYVDGTANFYALVQLKPDEALGTRGGLGVSDAFGVLYVDEQTYFSGRWRLLHPDDRAEGGTSMVAAVATPDGQQLFGFDPARFWCPFRSGHVTRRSRMATSRQVVAVTGTNPATGEAEIYTVNFSYSSMDRTWRWRPMPAGARAAYFADDAAAGRAEVPAGLAGDVVYPETLRLREDMTLCMRGSRGGVVGWWVQRYLPTSQRVPAPAAPAAPPVRPPTGFGHPWRFLAEPAFQVADRHSHLGVLDAVDGRSQYYRLDVDATAVSLLEKSAAGTVWRDVDGRLGIRALRFWWSAPLRVPAFDVRPSEPVVRPARRVPPSIFNPVTQLRIVRRGTRWIAVHHDKRDDDLLPFSPPEDALGNPVVEPVTLVGGAAPVTVTLRSHVKAELPPVLPYAELAFTGDPAAPMAVLLRGHEAVWRVRVAVVEPATATAPARVVHLRTVEISAFTALDDGSAEHRWAPTAAEMALLQQACSPTGAERYATTVWAEDVVGKVSVPDRLAFTRLMTAAVSPSSLPYGLPASLTVSALDAGSGASVSGTVHLPDGSTRPVGAAFTYTFTPQRVRRFDPEIRQYVYDEVPPTITVRAAGFRDVVLAPTFYTPSMRTSVDQAWLPIGRPAAVTVRAVDVTTGAAVAGRVRVNGVDVGATGVPFTYTCGATPPQAVVVATGYGNAGVAWPALRAPRLEVSVQPYPVPLRQAVSVTVRAVDADTRAAVDGAVLVDGVAVGRTNVAFTYTFAVRRQRVYQDGVWIYELITPSAVVRATGYPEAPVDLF